MTLLNTIKHNIMKSFVIFDSSHYFDALSMTEVHPPPVRHTINWYSRGYLLYDIKSYHSYMVEGVSEWMNVDTFWSCLILQYCCLFKKHSSYYVISVIIGDMNSKCTLYHGRLSPLHYSALLRYVRMGCNGSKYWGWHPPPPCVLRTALFWPCVLRTALFWHCVLRTV